MQISKKQKYAIAAGLGTLVGVYTFLCSLSSLNFAFNRSLIQPKDFELARGLLERAILLQMGNCFIEFGFWFVCIPVGLGCLFVRLSDVVKDSVVHKVAWLLFGIFSLSCVCQFGYVLWPSFAVHAQNSAYPLWIIVFQSLGACLPLVGLSFMVFLLYPLAVFFAWTERS